MAKIVVLSCCTLMLDWQYRGMHLPCWTYIIWSRNQGRGSVIRIHSFLMTCWRQCTIVLRKQELKPGWASNFQRKSCGFYFFLNGSIIYSFSTLVWIQLEWCWISLYPTHPAGWCKVNSLCVNPATFICPWSNLYCQYLFCRFLKIYFCTFFSF